MSRNRLLISVIFASLFCTETQAVVIFTSGGIWGPGQVDPRITVSGPSGTGQAYVVNPVNVPGTADDWAVPRHPGPFPQGPLPKWVSPVVETVNRMPTGHAAAAAPGDYVYTFGVNLPATANEDSILSISYFSDNAVTDIILEAFGGGSAQLTVEPNTQNLGGSSSIPLSDFLLSVSEGIDISVTIRTSNFELGGFNPTGLLASVSVVDMPDPGTPDPGTPDPGTPDPGTPGPGLPDPDFPDPDDIPEPTVFSILGAGLASLAVVRRRRPTSVAKRK